NLTGYLDAIVDEVCPPDAATIQILREETEGLTRIVADVEQLAIGDAGEFALQVAPVDVETLVGHVAASFAPAAESKGVRLVAHVADGLPDAQGDRLRLAQVLRNLVDNALTHTAAGGSIAIEAMAAGGRVLISVVDDGEGIPAEHLPFVFEPFYRADPSRGRSTGGAGLGLAIVKRLVEAHGGEATVRSEPGAGARFTVALPAAASGAGAILDGGAPRPLR
ncbi:MAG: sensor histidine kinase, partial [Dehalococcoidia bacterium]